MVTLKLIYGNISILLFSDADSLMYGIKKIEDVYEDVSNGKERFSLVIIRLSQNIMII